MECGVLNKLYAIIKSMYGRGQLSPFFKSQKGVRQGDNLSLILFNLPDIFDSNCDMVKMGNMSISSMIYADYLLIRVFVWITTLHG